MSTYDWTVPTYLVRGGSHHPGAASVVSVSVSFFLRVDLFCFVSLVHNINSINFINQLASWSFPRNIPLTFPLPSPYHIRFQSLVYLEPLTFTTCYPIRSKLHSLQSSPLLRPAPIPALIGRVITEILPSLKAEKSLKHKGSQHNHEPHCGCHCYDVSRQEDPKTFSIADPQPHTQ